MDSNRSDVIKAIDGGGLHLLNTSIVPPGCDGTWTVRTVSNEEAQGFVRFRCHDGGPLDIHVGHQATADVISLLMGFRVEPDRTPWNGAGCGLALQLRGRIPEGTILTQEQMDEIGYDWRVLYRLGEDGLPADAYRPGQFTGSDRERLLALIEVDGPEIRYVRRGGSRTDLHRYYSTFIGERDVTDLVTRILADPVKRFEHDGPHVGYGGSGKRGRELMVWTRGGTEDAALVNTTRQIAAALGEPERGFSWLVE